MLILFDIDATLVTTSRAGLRAMEAAGRELFGPGFSTSGVDFAGRLDPLILADLIAMHGREATATAVGAMRRGYATHLPCALDAGRCSALPGVHALLSRLRGSSGAALGLLTGNFEETGTLKLRACGIDPAWFAIRVWGDESPHTPPAREHLPGVASRRFERATARKLDHARSVVVGDTPHDVRCAAAHGMQSLGVATGQFSVQDLRGAGATHAVSDLSDTPGLFRWLVSASILSDAGG